MEPGYIGPLGDGDELEEDPEKVFAPLQHELSVMIEETLRAIAHLERSMEALEAQVLQEPEEPEWPLALAENREALTRKRERVATMQRALEDAMKG